MNLKEINSKNCYETARKVNFSAEMKLILNRIRRKATTGGFDLKLSDPLSYDAISELKSRGFVVVKKSNESFKADGIRTVVGWSAKTKSK